MYNSIDKKKTNLEDLQLTTDLLIIQEYFKKWLKLKPNNKELIKANDSLVRLSLLCNSLITDKDYLYIIAEEFREDKIRAIQRARKAETKIDNYEKNINNKKGTTNNY